MATSQVNSRSFKGRFLKRVPHLQLATLLMLGLIGFASAIAIAWFAGESTISQVFATLYALQANPLKWLQAPTVTTRYLLAPTVILWVTVLVVTKIIAPQPTKMSRWIVVGILLGLTARYILWRGLSTLNLVDARNGVFSLILFLLEMLMLASSTIQMFLMFNIKDRRREADRLAVSVIEGTFTPSVDILVPTYNEPAFIIKRTIIGCLALDYPQKEVYLLDDTRRPEIRLLAKELGCNYITRPDNSHAKAGNLNHAINKTNGELIVVFDADFVPTKNFLTRTVGFFQNKKVALVQTPQSFYNFDPIARNLGLENILTPEEEVFYRQIQLIKDGAGSAICVGTSFVMRRSALEVSGGFVTDSLSEDYFTGIRLSAQGYQLIYLYEKLSAGLAAENMTTHITQRIRWARGTLQAFFIDTNPLTIRGLSSIQRLAHLEGLLYWFTSISRIYLLIVPLIYSFIGIIPIRATLHEFLYYFLPYYVVQMSAFSWLNYRSRSALLSEIYSLVLCFPLALNVIQAMINPFSQKFNVTPKGILREGYTFNWSLGWPLIILFIATSISLWRNIEMSAMLGVKHDSISSLVLSFGWIWSGYNLIMIGINLLTLLDAPKPDIYEWFNLRRLVQMNVAEHIFWGVTTMISEGGAEVDLTQRLPEKVAETQFLGVPMKLKIMKEQVELQAQITGMDIMENFPTARIKFEQVSLSQQRQLVEMLFCRPGQWKRQNAPGELHSLLLILKILLRPRFLFKRNKEVSAIAVSQV